MKLFIAKYLFGFDPNKGEDIGNPQIIHHSPNKLQHVSKELKNKYLRYKANQFNSIFEGIHNQLKNGN